MPSSQVRSTNTSTIRPASDGLVFGPDPSTHDRCTIGGNLGNNSCGIHSVQSQVYGPGPRPLDSVEARWRSSPTTASASGRHRRGGPDRRDHDRRRAQGRDLRRAARPARPLRRRHPRAHDPGRAATRAGSPASTSTSCSRRTASTSPAPSSAPRAPAPPSLRSSSRSCRPCSMRTLVVVALRPDLPTAGDARRRDRRALRAHRPGGDRPQPHRGPTRAAHERGRSAAAARRTAGRWLLVQFGADTAEESEQRTPRRSALARRRAGLRRGPDQPSCPATRRAAQRARSGRSARAASASTAFPPDGRTTGRDGRTPPCRPTNRRLRP